MNPNTNLQGIQNASNGKAHVLYTKDSKNNIRAWACWVASKLPFGIFYTDFLINGKIKSPIFKASKPMNIGKANETTAEEQAVLMLQQEVGKKLRENYFWSIEEARNNKLFLPMLAEKYEKYAHRLKYPLIADAKIDGSRCNFYYSDQLNRVVAMSRTGKEIVSVPHLVNYFKSFLTVNKNFILDSEIYNHELKDNFEELMSLTRQSKPSVDDLKKSESILKAYLYDIFDKNDINRTMYSRNIILNNLMGQEEHSSNPAVLIKRKIVNNFEELIAFEEECLAEGYEGIMVRVPESIYKVDGRSADLLKKKIFTDEEFEIVDILEGDGAWKGCAKRVIIQLPDGSTQGAGIDGTFEVNRERLENKANYIGLLATVKYFGKTQDGLLRFPVVKDINRHD